MHCIFCHYIFKLFLKEVLRQQGKRLLKASLYMFWTHSHGVCGLKLPVSDHAEFQKLSIESLSFYCYYWGSHATYSHLCIMQTSNCNHSFSMVSIPVKGHAVSWI